MRLSTIIAVALPCFVLTACDAPALQADACDRACRLETATSLLTTTATLAPSIRATQNGADTAPTGLWLNGAANLDVHAAFADADSPHAVLFGTGIGVDGQPAVFGLRAAFDGSTPTELELIIARDGEASLFPPIIPITRQAIFDEPVPETQRTPRDTMIALADAYFDGIAASNGDALPILDTCERIENGVQTTHSARLSNLACNTLTPFVYITEVRDRRYPIVDAERGVVVAAAAFNIPGGDYVRTINGVESTRTYEPRSLILFEAFKIVDGKVALIEAAMRNTPLGAPMGW